MTRSYTVNAIVIRRINYSETDKILTLFSRENGRFSAIAKGARKAISRHTGSTEVLTCTKFQIAKGKSLDVITQSEVKEAFSSLKQELIKLAHGLYAVDLLDHVVEDHAPNPYLYDLVMVYLYLIQRSPNVEIVTRWFELQLLTDLGYTPDLEYCAVCNNRVDIVENARYALSSSNGGILCSYHERAGTNNDHSILSAEGLGLMRKLSAVDIEDAQSLLEIIMPKKKCLDQIRLALRRYLRYRIDADLNSIAFLDSLM